MLYETYRPASWSQFIGNAKATARLRRAVDTAKASSRSIALWIDGASGTGKTTLAKIIADELTGDAIDTQELDGDSCTVDAVREVGRNFQYKPMAGGYRVLVVNEAHAMTSRAVQAFLTMLEKLPGKRAVIFTTTEGREKVMFGTFDAPLKSRCLVVSLSNQGLSKAFAARAQVIAESEGLGGASAKAYLRLVQDCKNNMRAVLTEIEFGAMLGEPPATAAAA